MKELISGNADLIAFYSRLIGEFFVFIAAFIYVMFYRYIRHPLSGARWVICTIIFWITGIGFWINFISLILHWMGYV